MLNKRINKREARKLYNHGRKFWITAVNMRIECGLLVDPLREPYTDLTFDDLCNRFEYYNCNNETGRYCAFYEED